MPKKPLSYKSDTGIEEILGESKIRKPGGCVLSRKAV
jgi:hypothetical protein